MLHLGLIKQLLGPANYLRVRGDCKREVDLVLPLIAGVAASLILVGVGAPILTDKGIVSQVNNLLQVLVGFYVAALAAIATFPNPALDQHALNLSLKGEPISRRRYLSLIFGYLAFAGMFLYIGGSFASVSAAALHKVFLAQPFSKAFLLGAYSVVCANLVCVTLVGLYYLVDRIYKPEPMRVVKPDVRPVAKVASK